jgi:hypothetical protein
MSDEKKSTKSKNQNRIQPTGPGSHIGMGASAGLEGTSLQSPGSGTGWSGFSEGYEQLNEKGSATSGSGSRERRLGDQAQK